MEQCLPLLRPWSQVLLLGKYFVIPYGVGKRAGELRAPIFLVKKHDAGSHYVKFHSPGKLPVIIALGKVIKIIC